MRIGLFGGTFDPIHNGHIKAAHTAARDLRLNRLILIPAGDPPHKTGRVITDKLHRLAMVQKAAEAEGFSVSDWELNRREKSYSLDTIRHFTAIYPEDELFFIIGADSFRDLPKWWHYRELMALCVFAVVSRPDVPRETLLSQFCGDEKPPRVFFLNDVAVDVSSTQIRAMAARGEDVSSLVPPTAAEYIKTHKLYQ